MLERWSQVDICPPEDPDFRYYTFFFLFYLFLQSPDLNSVLFWIANFVLLLFYFKQPTNLIWSREQSSTTQEVGTRRRFVQFRQLGWWWSLFSVRNLLKTSPPPKKRDCTHIPFQFGIDHHFVLFSHYRAAAAAGREASLDHSLANRNNNNNSTAALRSLRLPMTTKPRSVVHRYVFFCFVFFSNLFAFLKHSWTSALSMWEMI